MSMLLMINLSKTVVIGFKEVKTVLYHTNVNDQHSMEAITHP